MPKPLFTAETARAAAALSVAAKKARKERIRLEVLADAPRKLLTVDPDAFQSERLSRVRTQLRMIDSMIEQERDPMKLDRLASAQSRLAEQERILRNAPLPGSYRPVQERAPRRQAGPVAPLSQPVQPVAQAPVVASADDYSI